MEFSKTRARYLFNKMYAASQRLGFDEVTDKEKNKIKDMLSYEDPKIPRIEETKHQVSIKKQIEELTIWAHLSYDRSIKNFTKAGRIWIHITAPKREKGDQKLYTSFFSRTESGNFVRAFIEELTFLVYALQQRPIDSKKRFMEIQEKPTGIFNWVSVSDPKEKITFFHKIPSGIQDSILKTRRIKLYYLKVLRKKLGIKKRARKMRKVRKLKTPNNRVPIQ